jgi:hypothetical protein
VHVDSFVWAAAALVCLGGGAARLTANALLRLFASLEPELWRRAGEPSGLFSRPRGRWSLTLGDPVTAWLMRTPTWVCRHPRAQTLLGAMRVATALMLLGLFGLATVITFAL